MARAEAQLAAHAGGVHAAAEAQVAPDLVRQRGLAGRAARRAHQRAPQRPGDRQRRAAGVAQGARERDDAVGRDVDRAAHRVEHRAAQGADRVLGVEQLHARVVAEHGGDDRRAHEAVDRRVEVAPDDRLQPQHGAGHRGVAAGERAHQALELADVALEARAQREAVGVLLGEEGRGAGLGAVDGGRAADDDGAQGGQPVAHRQQLQGADDVDVVEGRARAPGLGELDDVVVDHGVDRRGAHRGRQVGAAQVGLQDVDALGEVGIDRPRVDADDALDAGVARQAAREPRAERVRHAGDEDAPAGHASAALRWRTPAAGWPAAAWPAGAWPAWCAGAWWYGPPRASGREPRAPRRARAGRRSRRSPRAAGPRASRGSARRRTTSSSAICWARSRVKPAWPAVASMACAAAARTASPRLCCFLSAAGSFFFLPVSFLAKVRRVYPRRPWRTYTRPRSSPSARCCPTTPARPSR